MKRSNYQKISAEKDKVLYYTGRILSTSNIKAASEMSSVIKDLSATTFQVPLVYKHSPLAYGLINKVHWYSMASKHSGVETLWWYVLKTAYIIFQWKIVKKIRINCERCQNLRKKVLDVEMGPVSKYNLTIACLLCHTNRYLWAIQGIFKSSQENNCQDLVSNLLLHVYINY